MYYFMLSCFVYVISRHRPASSPISPRVFSELHARPVSPESRKRRPGISSPASSTFLFDSTLFPSITCALFFATAPSQPFYFQSLPRSFSANGGCPLSRLSSDLATQRLRFSRRPSPLTPLEATLASHSISVASKGLTEYLNPLYATLTKMGGAGAHLIPMLASRCTIPALSSQRLAEESACRS
jgi:hypothetical protein